MTNGIAMAMVVVLAIQSLFLCYAGFLRMVDTARRVFTFSMAPARKGALRKRVTFPLCVADAVVVAVAAVASRLGWPGSEAGVIAVVMAALTCLETDWSAV